MEKILRGLQHFQTQIFPKNAEEFQRLANKQQRPIALLITCSDSRINPNLVTQTDPGDLFLLRNAGNIIPPFGASAGGEAATIDYAVSVLGIKHIIICGHSHCGAMQALLRAKQEKLSSAVSNWFQHAESTRRIIEEKFADLSGEELVERAAEQNVLVQLAHIQTHPSVAAALATGAMSLHGWYYRIETGETRYYSPSERRFLSLVENDPQDIVSDISRLSLNLRVTGG
jgi:carbonic anhydrase